MKVIVQVLGQGKLELMDDIDFRFEGLVPLTNNMATLAQVCL